MMKDLPLKPICLAALSGDKVEQARLADAIIWAVNQLDDANVVYLGLIATAGAEGYLRRDETDAFIAQTRKPGPEDWFRIFSPIVRGAVLDEKDCRSSLVEMVGWRLVDLVEEGLDLGGTLRYVIWDKAAQP
jgi:hypothetical protein